MSQTRISNDSPTSKNTEGSGDEKKSFFCLRVLDREGRNIDLVEREYTIGRAYENKIVINDFYNLVSRWHAIIDLHNNKCTFTDLPTSSNGSYYQHPEGEKIDSEGKRWRRMTNNAPYPIEEDMIIRLGGAFSKKESKEWVCEIEIVKATLSKRKPTKIPTNQISE